MNASQFPGQTLAPIPGISGGEDEFSNIQKINQLLFNIVATGTAPSGSAGGDLSGTYPNPTVAKVNGVAAGPAPVLGQVPTATSPTAFTWQTPATTSPGGANTNIQYNNSGVFGGTASFVFSGTTVIGWSNSASRLTLTGIISDGSDDTVRITSSGRTDFTINSTNDIAVLAFATNGTRTWNNYADTNFHIQKVGVGDILLISSSDVTVFAGVALKLGNTATTGLTAGVLAALTNASVTLKDAAGTLYRVPCIV